MATTLFERVWDTHVVRQQEDEPALLYVDLHLIHEVTSPQAFEGLRLAGRPVRRPDRSLATMDHNVPTVDGPITDPLAKAQLDALLKNCGDFARFIRNIPTSIRKSAALNDSKNNDRLRPHGGSRSISNLRCRMLSPKAGAFYRLMEPRKPQAT